MTTRRAIYCSGRNITVPSCLITSQTVEKVGIGRKCDLENAVLRKEKNTEIMLDQSFQVLPCCDHHSFDIHFEKTPQAKSPQTMKLLGFPKQRLDPYTSLTHGFLVCFRLAISLCSVE